MPARRLEHYTIWTVRFEETVRFYVDVLGLFPGPRPSSIIPGAWIYDDGDKPVVHLVDVAKDASKPMLQSSGRDAASLRGSGSIDHVAFEAVDIEELKSKLTAAGSSFRQEEIPAMNLRQIFVLDPNGVQVELNFRGSPQMHIANVI